MVRAEVRLAECLLISAAWEAKRATEIDRIKHANKLTALSDTVNQPCSYLHAFYCWIAQMAS